MEQSTYVAWKAMEHVTRASECYRRCTSHGANAYGIVAGFDTASKLVMREVVQLYKEIHCSVLKILVDLEYAVFLENSTVSTTLQW